MKPEIDINSAPDLHEAKKRGKLAKSQEDEAEIKPSPFLIEWGKGKKYFIETFGCQMNVRDSEIIRGYLEEIGMTMTKDSSEASFILFNTCAVRENAEDHLYGELGHVKVFADSKPGIIVAVCGCMMQLEVPFRVIRDHYPYVNLVFGTNNIDQLFPLMDDCLRNSKRVLKVVSDPGRVVEGFPSARMEKYRAFVNITYGCDKFCTYCIVPFTRGMQRSRRDKDVLAEVRDLVRHGYKEVTLLGQNVSSYGMDLENNMSFAELLEAVSETGIERIRYVTSHPHDFTDDVFDVMAKHSNIMPYLHLPVQSGSNHVLRLMNRSYDLKKYMHLVDLVKQKVPDISLTTDIIVGFPGETEEDFQETLDVVKKVRYDSAYTFIFSPRPGTPAYKMKNNATPEEILDRFMRLKDVVDKITEERADEWVGKTVEVLFLYPSKRNSSMMSGYDRHNHLVHVKGDKSIEGKILKVKIIESHVHSFIGELVDE